MNEHQQSKNVSVFTTRREIVAARYAPVLRLTLALMLLSIVVLQVVGVWFGLGITSIAYQCLIVSSVGLLAALPFTATQENRKLVVALGMGLDLGFIALLVYLTGGTGSFFAQLYFLPILATGMLMEPRWAVACAGISSALQTGIAVLYAASVWFGITPPFVQFSWSEAVAYTGIDPTITKVLIQVMGYFLVALLTSHLSSRMRAAKLLSNEILENIAEAVIATDKSGRIAFINREAIQLFNFNRQTQLAGKKIAEVFRRESDKPIREALAGKETGRQTIWIEDRQSQTEREFEVTGSQIPDAKGSFRGVVAVFTDLSLQKRAEKAERRAKRLDYTRHVAAAIAHEVRNPLACVRGAVQQVLAKQRLSKVEKELVSITISECDRLECVISEFLEFARPPKVSISLIDMAEVLREVALLLGQRPGISDKRLHIEISDSLPCNADLRLMKQVFLNLGVNAFEAMSPEGVLTIRASSQCNEGIEGVIIEFADEGEGIRTEVSGRIFEPFFTTKPKGTGLGLAITRQIVEAHGGDVSATSNQNEGATFGVWLPVEGAKVPANTEALVAV